MLDSIETRVCQFQFVFNIPIVILFVKFGNLFVVLLTLQAQNEELLIEWDEILVVFYLVEHWELFLRISLLQL